MEPSLKRAAVGLVASLLGWAAAWLAMTGGWGGDGPGNGLVAMVGLFVFTPVLVLVAGGLFLASRGVGWARLGATYGVIALVPTSLVLTWLCVFVWNHEGGLGPIVVLTPLVFVASVTCLTALFAPHRARRGFTVASTFIVAALAALVGIDASLAQVSRLPPALAVPLLILTDNLGESRGTDAWCYAAQAGNGPLVRALIAQHSNPVCPGLAPLDPLACALARGDEALAIAVIRSTEYEWLLREGDELAQKLNLPRVNEAIARRRAELEP
jgi:hypothetical protein